VHNITGRPQTIIEIGYGVPNHDVHEEYKLRRHGKRMVVRLLSVRHNRRG
jgi:hypothetical protein